MTRWSMTALGVAVVTSLSLVAVTLWQGRTGMLVKAEDVAELMEALQERAYAVGGTKHVITNKVPVWTTASTRYAHHLDETGTNIVYSNHVECLTYSPVVRTNWYFDRHTLEYEREKGVQIGRYITADGTQAVVTADGTYTLNRITPVSVACGDGEYVEVFGSVDVHFAGDGVGLAIDGNGRWVFGSYWDVYFYASVATVDLEKGLTAARWASYMEGGYTEYATNVHVTTSAPSTNFPAIEAPAFEYAPANWAQGRQIVLGDLADIDAAIFALVPLFADDSKAVGGTFAEYLQTPLFSSNYYGGAWHVVTNYPTTLPMNTVTGLWARLGIGDRTNRFTRTPAHTVPSRQRWVYTYTTLWPAGAEQAVCYTDDYRGAVSVATVWDGQGGAASNFTWSTYSNATAVTVPASNVPATYGDWPLQIYTNDLMERARVLASLQWTAPAFVWTNWAGDRCVDVTNSSVTVTGGVPFASWSSASGNEWYAQTQPSLLSWWEDTGTVFQTPAAGWEVDKIGTNCAAATNGNPETSFTRTWSYAKTQNYQAASWGGAYWLQAPDVFHAGTYQRTVQANSNRYVAVSASPAWAMPYWPCEVVYDVICYGITQTLAGAWSGSRVATLAQAAGLTHQGGPTNAQMESIGIADTIADPAPGAITNYSSQRTDWSENQMGETYYYYNELDVWSGSTNQATGVRYLPGQALLKWHFTRCAPAP